MIYEIPLTTYILPSALSHPPIAVKYGDIVFYVLLAYIVLRTI
jgi:hypothetical protein